MADDGYELHEALRNGAPADTIQRLLAEHPDQVGLAWDEGQRPMHYACQRGASLAAMRLLLDADPGCLRRRDDYGRTPLHFALTRFGRNGGGENGEEEEAILFLVERDPEALRVEDEDRMLPLHTALKSRASERVIEALLRGHPSAAEDRSGGSDGYLPLHWACIQGGAPSVVSCLLRAYPDAIRDRAREGHLPLHFACKHPATPFESVKLLVDAYPEGAREIDRDYNRFPCGDTIYPVHWACNGLPGTAKSVRFLLSSFPGAAEVRTPKHYGGEYLLHTVVRTRGPLDIVKELVGIHPRALHEQVIGDMHMACNGYYPLHYACQEGAPRSVIKCLMEEAPEHLRSLARNDQTPLHLLFVERRTPALLLSDDEDPPSLVDLVGQMIELYPDSVKRSNKFGEFVLHVACKSFAPLPVIQLLVDLNPLGLLQKAIAKTPKPLASTTASPPLALEIAQENIRCYPDEARHRALLQFLEGQLNDLLRAIREEVDRAARDRGVHLPESVLDLIWNFAEV